jgi:hypothetical protein
MGQTNEELTENLAEWLCWEVARRDDVCIAPRLYRKPVVKVLLQKLVFDPLLMLTDVCSVHATRRRSSSARTASPRCCSWRSATRSSQSTHRRAS